MGLEADLQRVIRVCIAAAAVCWLVALVALSWAVAALVRNASSAGIGAGFGLAEVGAGAVFTLIWLTLRQISRDYQLVDGGGSASASPPWSG